MWYRERTYVGKDTGNTTRCAHTDKKETEVANAVDFRVPSNQKSGDRD